MTTDKSIIITKEEAGTRINVCLSKRGLGTRKSIDALVAKGGLLVNDKIAVLGQRLNTKDIVTFKQSAGPKEGYVYFAYNKPVGVVTSAPGAGEKDILTATKFPSPVFPVGRLDKDSTGLILMTNDGRVTDRLLSPKHNHEKEYSVTVDKPITHVFLTRLISGIEIGTSGKGSSGESYMTEKAKARRTDKFSFDIVLTEGKNRQIRRMCAAFGYGVKSLTRIRIMNILLGNLKAGQFRALKGKEQTDFLKSLGL